jgi:hypothetical protein
LRHFISYPHLCAHERHKEREREREMNVAVREAPKRYAEIDPSFVPGCSTDEYVYAMRSNQKGNEKDEKLGESHKQRIRNKRKRG